MTAIERLVKTYAAKLPERDLSIDLLAHATWGFLHCERDLIAFGRPVRSDASDAELADTRIQFENPDAWLVAGAALAGGKTLRDLREKLPYFLPLIIFWRAGCGPWRRAYKLSKLEARI